jgi:alcohol dehydrogenase
MAHSLGGALDLAHGECNAILLEEVVRYNYAMSEQKYDQLARELGVDLDRCKSSQKADALAEQIASLRKKLGITQRLSDMGVRLSDISTLASFAYKDPCLSTNPRAATPEEIEKIYRKIYQ